MLAKLNEMDEAAGQEPIEEGGAPAMPPQHRGECVGCDAHAYSANIWDHSRSVARQDFAQRACAPI
eukprot:1298351-Lingulodinium_polyedra.AAC.1